jgi:hypothetical protein
MRRLVLVLALGSVLAATSTYGADAAQSSGRHTQRVVSRPVTAAGRPAPGYRVTVETSPRLDCSAGEPSPVAVDQDIVYCTPDYADAVACWKSSSAHHVLCLRDARHKTLVKLRVSGPTAGTSALPKRAPLDVQLNSGVTCALRVGGAGTSLKQHPSWSIFYFCSHGLAIWAPLNATNWGLNRAHPVWTAHVAASSGGKRVAKRGLSRTWFVGTAG